MIERLNADRAQDWQSRMHAFLIWAQKQTLEWGIFDCGLFAALHIDAICGTEIHKVHALQYHDRAGLIEYMGSLGLADHDALATAILGEKLSTPRLAQRGDVVLFNTPDDGPAFAIVDLTGTEIVGLHPSGTGLARVPRITASAAWRV